MNNKQNDFKKSIKVKNNIAKGAAMVTTLGIIGTMAYESNPDKAKYDLSKYADNGNKIVEYADENMAKDLQMMEQNVKTYKELSSKMFLSDEEKAKLENAKESIRNEILSDDLSEFYLEDIFKSKIKSAYSAEYVEVQYDINNMAEEFMTIDIYEVKPTSKLDKPDITINKNEIPREVKAAIDCIVDFQEFAECTKEQIKEGSIKKAVKYFESMKGFANMNLTKTENGKLEVKKPEKEVEK